MTKWPTSFKDLYRDVFVDFLNFNQGWFENATPMELNVLICNFDFSHLVVTGQKI